MCVCFPLGWPKEHSEKNTNHFVEDIQWMLHNLTLIYCDRLHAWWSTKSRLATLFSACALTGWSNLKKDLSVDERIGAWCHIFGQSHRGLTFGFLLLRYSVECNVSPYEGHPIKNETFFIV